MRRRKEEEPEGEGTEVGQPEMEQSEGTEVQQEEV